MIVLLSNLLYRLTLIYFCHHRDTSRRTWSEPEGSSHKIERCVRWLFIIMTKEELSSHVDKLYELNQECLNRGEIPVSACLITKNSVYYARNRVEELNDPYAHAEFLVLTQAMKKEKRKYLNDSILIVTLEPCLLCMVAILKANVSSLYYIMDDKNEGSLSHYHLFADPKIAIHQIADIRFSKQFQECFERMRIK